MSGGNPDAENPTVPVKLVAVSLTVTVAIPLRETVTELALRVVATVPMLTGKVTA